MSRYRLKPEFKNLPRFHNIVAESGFEEIGYGEGIVWWKAFDENTLRHIILRKTGNKTHHFPDWTHSHIEINICRGPDLFDNIIHKEIAYNPEDLMAFIDAFNNGEFNDF
jgi:hypothetical protein